MLEVWDIGDFTFLAESERSNGREYDEHERSHRN